MVSQRYKNAYKEVLEIIKYLPKQDLYKIPNEKIEYLERNQNVDYDFNFDISIPLEEQNISREANAIILNLFNDYFISDKQKEKLASFLDINEKKYQEKQREKYNPDDIFKPKQNNFNIQISEEQENNLELIEYKKQKWYQKIFAKILKIFRIS